MLYGQSAAERTSELRAIARWFDRRAREMNDWEGDHNLIALGDFNIDRKGDGRYEAFTSTVLTVPRELHDIPRTIFSDPNDPERGHFYDQIAWLTEADGRRPALSLEYRDDGSHGRRAPAP